MPRPFSVDDLHLHQRITELHAARGLDRVALTVRSVDRENDDYRTAIWTLDTGGGAPRQLTRGPGKDNTPRWSPDGRQLAFLSDRGGSIQVWLLSCDGGEARTVGSFRGTPSALRWSPDGRTLYACASVPVDPDWRGARGKDPRPRGPKSPEVAWKLPYKSDGIGYLLAREIHLFAIDIASGNTRQLSDGGFDVLGFDVSANGRHLAYARTRAGRFAHCTDLWVCDADGSHHRQLTHDIAMVMQPLWSPDGRWILFSGNRDEGDAQSWMWLLEFATGQLRRLGGDDAQLAAPTDAHWSDDSRAVLFSRAWHGREQIARIAVEGGAPEVLRGGDWQLGGLAFTGRHFAYVVETPTEPSEVHLCAADGSGERRASDFNPWWRERTPMRLEARTFRVPDGRGGIETVQGWLMRSSDNQGPSPLLADMHGGPAAHVQLDYDTNVFWQVLCARGWAVLALDAVGSASYGDAFCKRLAGHWGEVDLPQHLEAIRQLEKDGVCDGRVAISGKSYGGFLSSWAVGHCDRFRAAVVMAPVGNIETHYGTSDGGYYADPTSMGDPRRFDRERARQLSPSQSVEASKTPTLFMQGADDERCPKCQSEEMFVSMARAGDTPCELVLYPGEDHHFLGDGAPSVRADAATRIVDWITAHAAG